MDKPSLKQLRTQVLELGDRQIAEHSERYFKTGPGEYGEGDQFIGIRMPVLRKLASENDRLSAADLQKLLKSSIHEERLLALLILVLQYNKADQAGRKKIYDAYLSHTQYINNWDLVDCSAHLIVGRQLIDRSRRPLNKLAKSSSLWERRIAIMSTFAFIKQDDFDDTLKIAELLLDDEEDLIHKAVGWMLREIGKRDRKVEDEFLKQHYKTMPRTMLRYAIEKHPERQRKRYLSGKV